MVAGLEHHAGSTVGRLRCELGGDIARQTDVHACFRESFDDDVDEGRAGAGDGDGIVADGEVPGAERRFGAEEAARATSLEVDWQTGRWGEVEDTHDVEKEDVRRQFGAVVLLVSGTGRW